MSLDVLAAGLQTSVQDLGRPGYRHLGVGLSGAADAPALRLANLLVGNAESAAGLEITLSGPRLRFVIDAEIAICGAEIAAQMMFENQAQTLALRRPLRVPAGAEIRLGVCQRGVRAYLAIAGGLAVPEVLRSRSTDLGGLFGGHGGRALLPGDRLSIGPAPRETLAGGRFFAHETTWQDEKPDGACMLRIVMGTHGEKSAAELIHADWRVAADASRMGLRLVGPRLADSDAQLLSEAVVPGTVQLPPGGAPIVLGVEAPTTGGYARLAQVISADLPRIGQLRPGDAVRFRLISMLEARAALAAQERRLALLALALRTKKEPRTCSARSI